MSELIPVIIFGDHIASYGVIRGLSKYNIPIYMVSETGKGLASKSRYIKKSTILHFDDDNFILKLDNWIKKIVGPKAVLMVAGRDQYLDVLSKDYKKLSGEIKVTFPDWETVKLVREKRYTYKIAEKIGIPVPKTFYISSKNELDELLNNEKEKILFPVLMKPEDSARFLKKYGNKGIVCNNSKEVIDCYNRYEGFQKNLLVQEFIPGEESRLTSAVVVLNRKSLPIGYMINFKKRSEGQFLSCTVVETTWSDEVLNYSLKLIKEMGYYGYTGTQFKLDPRDGIYKLMEINGRITMSNSLALKCGTNLPYLMYKEAIGGPLPEIKEFKQEYPENIIWIFLIADIISYFKWNRKYFNFLNYLKSLKAITYIIEPFNWRDPYPGFLSIMKPFISIIKKIFSLKNKKRQ